MNIRIVIKNISTGEIIKSDDVYKFGIEIIDGVSKIYVHWNQYSGKSYLNPEEYSIISIEYK